MPKKHSSKTKSGSTSKKAAKSASNSRKRHTDSNSTMSSQPRAKPSKEKVPPSVESQTKPVDNPFNRKKVDPNLLTGFMSGHVDLDLPISDQDVQLIDDHCDPNWWDEDVIWPFEQLVKALFRDAENERRFRGVPGIEKLRGVAIRYPEDSNNLKKWEEILRGIPYYSKLLSKLTCPPEAAVQAILRWHAEQGDIWETEYGTVCLDFCSRPGDHGQVEFYLERNVLE